MFVYKFRILLENQDDFLRDIEIGSKQTFGDFHKALLASANLDEKEKSSFFVCDSKWKKLKELTLNDLADMQEPPALTTDEEELPQPAMPVFVMSNVKIKDMIDDPHQRLLYEYDSVNISRIFLIELLKINESKPDVEYPVCVKRQGQLASPAVPFIFDTEEPEVVDEEAMLQELNELVNEGQLDTESSDEAPPADLPW